jgi:hypothetical protein
MITKIGKDLRVGDSIKLWYGIARILRLERYSGPLSYLFDGVAMTATLDRGGITIDPTATYEVVA